MSWRGLITGVLGLALLEAAVSTNAAAGRIGNLLSGVSSVVSHVLSPTVPAIPDLRKHGSGGASTSSAPTGSGSVQPATSNTMPPDWNTSAASGIVNV